VDEENAFRESLEEKILGGDRREAGGGARIFLVVCVGTGGSQRC